MADAIRRFGRVAPHYFGQKRSRPLGRIDVIALAEVSKFNLNFLRAMVSDDIRLASGLAGLSARYCSKVAEDLWTDRRVEAGLPPPPRQALAWLHFTPFPGAIPTPPGLFYHDTRISLFINTSKLQNWAYHYSGRWERIAALPFRDEVLSYTWRELRHVPSYRNARCTGSGDHGCSPST